jgi:hypothetical protein
VNEKQLYFLRSDPETETLLIANAQLMLAQQQDYICGHKA